METKSNYYIPSIDDIRMGLEVEIDRSEVDLPWELFKINSVHLITVALHRLMSEQYKDSIRIPYLTKEQIEAEGWIEYIDQFFNGTVVLAFRKDNYFMTYNTNEKSMEISLDSAENILINISIRCINDFRLICKMLGI